ncbi:hypothetical protein HK102_011984, partial [Quaeritorhiza haematococci]
LGPGRPVDVRRVRVVRPGLVGRRPRRLAGLYRPQRRGNRPAAARRLRPGAVPRPARHRGRPRDRRGGRRGRRPLRRGIVCRPPPLPRAAGRDLGPGAPRDEELAPPHPRGEAGTLRLGPEEEVLARRFRLAVPV